MANEPVITVVGNATGDAELRFAPSGTAVAAFTVAQTPRTLNRQTNQWDDGETIFMRVTAFGSMAENVAESVKRGTRVIATGRMQMDRWEDKEGGKHERMGMIADEVGVGLRFASATTHKAERGAPAAGGDPWATAAPPQAPQQPTLPAQAPQAPAQPQYAQSPPGTPWGQPEPGYSEPPF